MDSDELEDYELETTISRHKVKDEAKLALNVKKQKKTEEVCGNIHFSNALWSLELISGHKQITDNQLRIFFSL